MPGSGMLLELVLHFLFFCVRFRMQKDMNISESVMGGQSIPGTSRWINQPEAVRCTCTEEGIYTASLAKHLRRPSTPPPLSPCHLSPARALAAPLHPPPRLNYPSTPSVIPLPHLPPSSPTPPPLPGPATCSLIPPTPSPCPLLVHPPLPPSPSPPPPNEAGRVS